MRFKPTHWVLGRLIYQIVGLGPVSCCRFNLLVRSPVVCDFVLFYIAGFVAPIETG